jgi:hypothetical protein
VRTFTELMATLAVDHVMMQESAVRCQVGREVAGIPQLLRLHEVEALGAPWVIVEAPVCLERELSGHDALVRNGDLAVGSLALVGGEFVVRAAAALAELDAERLGRIVWLLAAEAVRLRRDARRTPVAAVFAEYAQ